MANLPALPALVTGVPEAPFRSLPPEFQVPSLPAKRRGGGGRRAAQAQQQWLSVQEFMQTYLNSPICSYLPMRGDRKGWVCAAPAINSEEIPDRFKWRCVLCIGKLGGIQNQLLTFDPNAPIPPKLQPQQERILDAKRKINCFVFDGEQLSLSYRPFPFEVEDQSLFIEHRGRELNLDRLATLCPRLMHLVLRVSRRATFSIGGLLEIKTVRRLEIEGECRYNQETNRITGKILDLPRLREMKLESLQVYGRTLDPENPVYEWPRVRDARFQHIRNIVTLGPLRSYFVHLPATGESVVIQHILDTPHYTLMPWGGDEDRFGEIETITAAKFEQLLGPGVPTTSEALWVTES